MKMEDPILCDTVNEISFQESQFLGRDLIEKLLTHQQAPTAVQRFSIFHEEIKYSSPKERYQHLIPLSSPTAGEQYSFEVNLDKCSGCKSCVSACHSLNGLDNSESWRSAGVLFGLQKNEPYQQTITHACHHCIDPACANGCPVLAYEKDSTTRIVRHLDDQCIGCQYCVLKCPYDVPKYNPRLGIVRKCDMCHERLATGEAPACVQACPHEAIVIKKVLKSEIEFSSSVNGKALLPGVVSSDYTKPTTSYISARPIPTGAQFGDHSRLIVEHAHYPLVFMLVLTQMAAGCFLAQVVNIQQGKPVPFLSLMGFAILSFGLIASILHLGRPLIGWKAFLGWRKSWLSREIIAFGLFAPLGLATVLGDVVSSLSPNFINIFFHINQAILYATTIVGGVGVFCSIMVYVDTHRPSWNGFTTGFKFTMSTLILGTTTAACFDPSWIPVSIAIILLKIIFEAGIYLHGLFRHDHYTHRSSLIISKHLRTTGIMRVTLALAAVSFLQWSPIPALILVCGGEFLERKLFFQTAVRHRMPGNAGAI